MIFRSKIYRQQRACVLLSCGRYPVHLPNGNTKILHNEQELLDFINEQRRQGFPVEVNPKWGWKLNEKRELIIPSVRFDWIEVHDVLRQMQLKIEDAEAHSEREPSEELAQKLNQLRARYAEEFDLVNRYVEINRLRLEPDIIYSEFLNNSKMKPSEGLG